MRTLLAAVVGGIVAAVLVTACSAPVRTPREAEAQPAARRQAWEYKIVPLKTIPGYGRETEDPEAPQVTAHFAKLGGDGWEFDGTLGLFYATFKRPKP